MYKETEGSVMNIETACCLRMAFQIRELAQFKKKTKTKTNISLCTDNNPTQSYTLN